MVSSLDRWYQINDDLTRDVWAATTVGMGRKHINDEAISARFPKGTLARIKAVLRSAESQAELIRKAVEKEIALRERQADKP